MGIREDFKLYWDGNGLLAPHPCEPKGQASDNGPMFTSEYYMMLLMSGHLTQQDHEDFVKIIDSCVIDSLLNRAPYRTRQEGPDDYYGVLAACKKLGNTSIPRKLLWGTIKNLGFLNNEEPGKKTLSSFLVRQLQLPAAMIAASFPGWNPSHIAIRLLFAPLFLFSSLIIAISCIGTPTGETDARRLSWSLIQTVAPVSLFCWLAAQIWYTRLYGDYGRSGMKSVAKIYYQPKNDNPYAKHWISE